MFDEFKLLFLDSAKQLILPIREGYLALSNQDDLLDDEFQGALDVLALDLEFSAVKAFLQDGQFCEDELDVFMEIHGFLKRLTETEPTGRQIHRRVIDDMLVSWTKDGSLNEPFLPQSLRYIGAYDAINETDFIELAQHLFITFLAVCLRANGVVHEKEERYLKSCKELFWRVGSISKESKNISSSSAVASTPRLGLAENSESKDVDACIAELMGMVGIDSVKIEIQRLINGIKINNVRKERGLPVAHVGDHMVFYGNPGTGKTTVARLLAQIFRGLGVLPKGHLVEVDRSGLVAGYVGQTSIKTHEVVNLALGGVLFIDEAYSLYKDGNDYGAEAIDALLKLMEDNRGNLIVIAAGYTDRMSEFLSSNPGLKSRFTKFLNFPDYVPSQLMEIFFLLSRNQKMEVDHGARLKLERLFCDAYDARLENFGNGRLVRNVFYESMSKQADRIVNVEHLTEQILQTITEDDIPDVIPAL